MSELCIYYYYCSWRRIFGKANKDKLNEKWKNKVCVCVCVCVCEMKTVNPSRQFYFA